MRKKPGVSPVETEQPLIQGCSTNQTLGTRGPAVLGPMKTELSPGQGGIYSHFHSLLNVSDAEIQRDDDFCLLVDGLIVVISHQLTENSALPLVKFCVWMTTNYTEILLQTYFINFKCQITFF